MKTMRERATEILVSLTGRHEDAEPSAEDVLISALESARASGVEKAALLLEDGARVSELHARVTTCPQARDRFLHLAKFERLHAEDIRALTKKENGNG